MFQIEHQNWNVVILGVSYDKDMKQDTESLIISIN